MVTVHIVPSLLRSLYTLYISYYGDCTHCTLVVTALYTLDPRYYCHCTVITVTVHTGLAVIWSLYTFDPYYYGHCFTFEPHYYGHISQETLAFTDIVHSGHSLVSSLYATGTVDLDKSGTRYMALNSYNYSYQVIFANLDLLLLFLCYCHRLYCIHACWAEHIPYTFT